MKYTGILRRRKPWVKVTVIILATYMLFLQIMAQRWGYIPLAVLVILACFFEKKHVVSKDGVDIEYRLFGFMTHNYWRWGEITTLHTDFRKAKPNVMLHIGRDIAVRTFIMKPSDCREVLELAAEMNPDIYIERLTEEEQEKREREILQRKAVNRAWRKEKKRK